MANTGRVNVDGGDMMRYAEYTPKDNVRSDAEIDRRLGGTLIAVGLGVAAAGFAVFILLPRLLFLLILLLFLTQFLSYHIQPCLQPCSHLLLLLLLLFVIMKPHLLQLKSLLLHQQEALPDALRCCCCVTRTPKRITAVCVCAYPSGKITGMVSLSSRVFPEESTSSRDSGRGVEVQSQLQSLLSLLSADAELFPDSVESWQSVSGRARRTAQRLTEDNGRLQQLTAIIICALKEEMERQRQTVKSHVACCCENKKKTAITSACGAASPPSQPGCAERCPAVLQVDSPFPPEAMTAGARTDSLQLLLQQFEVLLNRSSISWSYVSTEHAHAFSSTTSSSSPALSKAAICWFNSTYTANHSWPERLASSLRLPAESSTALNLVPVARLISKTVVLPISPRGCGSPSNDSRVYFY
ncbi:hypothetical protein FQN60_001087 [Etheostoma spectabile]|uniref:Uncharacterized protein n=1 Tax=Etheostoma spectabile TaxID=54343 RepID=A0A5J5D450_9PERO|nr:hypothetical protein FQN60_001087 [Etheostoma spectabile]